MNDLHKSYRTTDVAVPGYVNTARPREGKVEIGEAKVVPESNAKKK